MFLFKPYRRSNESVNLTKERCSYNDLRGVETSIYLDLNVLSKIRKVMLGEEEFSDEFSKAFEKIRSLNVYLSPGLALDEVKHDLLLPTIEQFEKFCIQLGISNAYNWIPYDYNKNKKTILSFFDLHPDQKIGLMTIYNSILSIHYIYQKYKHETDQNKFKLYIDSMLSKTDVLDALGCTIASYCFVRDCKASLLKRIKENFLKLKDKRPVILKSLNAARDVQFIRTLALREYYSYIDGGNPMECWCMTADQGLKAFSDFIFGSSAQRILWIDGIRRTGLKPLVKVANTLKKHLSALLNYYKHGKISNGKAEGINNKIKTLKRQSYGFRDSEYFKLRLYHLHAQKDRLCG